VRGRSAVAGAKRAVALGMNADIMRARTDKFSVDVIHFCRSLPADPFTRRIALQLHDAGTSVASNYHAACRAQSRAMFIAKLSIALEEADECVGWLHKLAAANLASGPALAALQQEASELVAILSASRKTAITRRPRRRR
jgi:four helix bundle protein